MILIDTNILVYATLPGFPEHKPTSELLSELLAGRVGHCLTWINIFEYLRVVTHRRLVRPAPLGMDKALENIQALISQPLISRIDP
jgi:predicted nucleic acid-binding protein